MWPQAVGRECNASAAKRPVGVQGEAATERSPWAAAGRWKSPPGRGGLQVSRILSVVSVMRLTRDDLYASVGNSVDKTIRSVYPP